MGTVPLKLPAPLELPEPPVIKLSTPLVPLELPLVPLPLELPVPLVPQELPTLLVQCRLTFQCHLRHWSYPHRRCHKSYLCRWYSVA